MPPFNPHDEVELAPNLPAALEDLWTYEASSALAAASATGGSSSDSSSSSGSSESGSGSSGSSSSLEALSAAYRAALSAGRQALQQEVNESLARSGAAGAADGADAPASEVDVDGLISRLEGIKVAAGSRISNSLVAALEALTGGDMGRVEFLVAALCWLRLRAMPTPLLVDLAALVLEAGLRTDDGGEAEQAHAAQFRHYSAMLAPEGETEDEQAARGKAAAAAAVEMRNKGAAAAAAGGGEAAQLAAIQYRASKKMQLYDVIIAVAAARDANVGDLERRLEVWAEAGSKVGAGKKVPPPPWRADAMRV